MPPSPYDRDPQPLQTIIAEPDRPILLAHAQVITNDATLGDWSDADVLLGKNLIVGVGPGLESAAGDDGMIVVDCRGCLVLASGGGRVSPGEPANLLVIRLEDSALASDTPQRDRPSHTDIRLEQGRPVLWGGAPVDGPTAPSLDGVKLVEIDASHPRVGLWVDETDFLHQRLLPDGRYDETRGGRPHAYQGQIWIDGDRIDYLDDLGFWAFGTFVGDRLEHAGYILHKRED